MLFEGPSAGGDQPTARRPATPTSGEAAQVQRAKAGDEAVWDGWFDAFFPKLYRYAFVRLRRKAEAEDIASAVFLEAVRQIDRFQYTGRPILAWLYGIAHNLVHDRLKQAARAPEPDDVALGTQITGPDEPAPDIDLMNAVNELSDEQRDVIILRFYLSLSAQEVSELIGRSPAAVYSLQTRAIVNLRERLR